MKTQQTSGMRRRAIIPVLAVAVVLLPAAIRGKSADAQTFDILYSFTGQADGGQPVGGLIRDAEGTLYGTTCCGGTYGAGTVFMLDRAGKETVLYSFTGGADGDQPYASLIRDAKGNLYGTTYWGGVSSDCNGGTGCGVVFKLDPNGKETVLHAFTGTGGDGANPYDGLVEDYKGALYGTTVNGGNLNACAGGCGMVFSVDMAREEKVLYSFKAGTDGANPFAGLVRDEEGNLYGTTTYGGSYGQGTVFELERSGRERVLYTFTGGADGGQPLLGYLVRDARGNLFGTTVRGGAASCAFLCGTVFELERSGKERALYGFLQGTDGANPYGGLAEDDEGNLYGTTNQGGAANYGTVFKLNRAGKETVLHTFTGTGGDGAGPYNGPILDRRGNLYGAAADGGESGCYLDLGCGVVYKLTLDE
jgi:uncharacterized repeat protein (TIGR03803 family)